MIKNRLYISDANKCLELLENNSIKVIYIDPPYNTKNKKFEYNDNNENWIEDMKNILNKAYLTLKIEGVIFISIDDTMFSELKLICDEIFSKKNFIGTFITRQATRSNTKQINIIHEYILCYGKNKNLVPAFSVYRKDLLVYKEIINDLILKIKTIYLNYNKSYAEKELKKSLKEYLKKDGFDWIKNYNLVDDNGEIFFAKDLSTPSEPKELYIEEINLTLPKLKTRGWVSKEKIIKLYKENKLYFKNDRPYEKHYLIDSKDNAMSILNFYSRQGKHDLEKLGMGDMFSTAKPVELIKYLIKISSNKNDIILDFFAGSGTTAEAVLKLNKEENSERKFILCQIDEKILNNKKSIEKLKSYNYKNSIASITKFRLKKLEKLYNYEYEIIE